MPCSLGAHQLRWNRFGVSVRAMDSIVTLANVHRTDYWRRGRTVDKLGFSTLSVSELTFLLMGVYARNRVIQIKESIYVKGCDDGN